MSVLALGKDQDLLLRLSAQLGNDPLLVQASSGNTSLKSDGTLWIKASGKWMASADKEEIFVPVNLAHCLQCFEREIESVPADPAFGQSHLRPSVETFMHAVLPHRVVIHVHSVNTIAWAVRGDAVKQLSKRLEGLSWQWIPFAHSGIPLARAIQSTLLTNRHATVFVLANHGLVVCADDCAAAESLLWEVEQRLRICPRPLPPSTPDFIQWAGDTPEWYVAPDQSLHSLGTDALSFRIASTGILYPCQAMFLGEALPSLLSSQSHATLKSHFVVVKGHGVLIDRKITAATYAVLKGFVEVLRRVDSVDLVHFLAVDDVSTILHLYSPQYTAFAENRALRTNPASQLQPLN